jgi:hypothetical protein
MAAASKPAPAPADVPETAADAAPTAKPPFWSVIAEAIAQRIVAPPRTRPLPQPSSTSLLDFILVVGALVLIGGGLYGLFTIQNIPKETLPIIASLLSFISGSILGAYAGYRWGASDTMKKVAIANATGA